MADNEPTRAGPIGVCMHSYNNVPFDNYFNHLYCVAHWSQQFSLVFAGKSGLDAASARNALVKRCLEKGCTHAFFMDEDHFFPVETLACLWESRDAAMVSGVVCKKGEGFQQVGWEIRLQPDGPQYYQVTLPLDGNVYETNVCAFGCTLINLSKLAKLPEPWFRDTCIGPEGSAPVNIRSDVNLGLAFMKAGEKSFIDTRILIGHMGVPTIVYPQSAEQLKQLKSLEFTSTQLRESQRGFYYTPW